MLTWIVMAAIAQTPAPASDNAFGSPGMLTFVGRGQTQQRVSEVHTDKTRITVLLDVFRDGQRVSVWASRTGTGSTGQGYNCADQACAASLVKLRHWAKAPAGDKNASFDAVKLVNARPTPTGDGTTQTVELMANDEKVTVALSLRRRKYRDQFGTRPMESRLTVTGFGQRHEGEWGGWHKGEVIERVLVRDRDVYVIGLKKDAVPGRELEEVTIRGASLYAPKDVPVRKDIVPVGFSIDRSRVSYYEVDLSLRRGLFQPARVHVVTRDVRTGALLKRRRLYADRETVTMQDIRKVTRSFEGGEGSYRTGSFRHPLKVSRFQPAPEVDVVLDVPPFCPPGQSVPLLKHGDGAPFGLYQAGCTRGAAPREAISFYGAWLAVVTSTDGNAYALYGLDKNTTAGPPQKPCEELFVIDEPALWLEGEALTVQEVKQICRRELFDGPSYGRLGVHSYERQAYMREAVERRLLSRPEVKAHAPSIQEVDEATHPGLTGKRARRQRERIREVLTLFSYGRSQGWFEPVKVDPERRESAQGENVRYEAVIREIQVSTRHFPDGEAEKIIRRVADAMRAGGDVEALGAEYGYEGYGLPQTKTWSGRHIDKRFGDTKAGDVLGPDRYSKNKWRVTLVERVDRRLVRPVSEVDRRLVYQGQESAVYGLLDTLRSRGIVRSRQMATPPDFAREMQLPIGTRTVGWPEKGGVDVVTVGPDGVLRELRGQPFDLKRLSEPTNKSSWAPSVWIAAHSETDIHVLSPLFDAARARGVRGVCFFIEDEEDQSKGCTLVRLVGESRPGARNVTVTLSDSAILVKEEGGPSRRVTGMSLQRLLTASGPGDDDLLSFSRKAKPEADVTLVATQQTSVQDVVDLATLSRSVTLEVK